MPLHQPRHGPFWSPFRSLLLLLAFALLVAFVIGTWRWPTVGDATLMRYVVFLIHHGKAPYRDIVDINFPGSYLVEWLVLHVAGSSALAWRLFDLALGLAALIAMLVIAWPWEWFAGIFAGTLFILLHGRDGIQEMGQRDLVIAVLLLGAYAALFCLIRRSRGRLDSALIALCGTLLGLACTIKPTALLFLPILLVLGAIELRRQNRRCLPLCVIGTAFALIPLLAAVLFLVREQALRPFIAIVLTILPDHAGLRRHSFGYLLLHALPGDLLPLLLLWAPLACVSRFLRTWEGRMLLAGVLLGLISFLAQGKGYSYQRYPAESLLLLTVAIDLALAAKASGPQTRSWAQPLAISALAFGLAVTGLLSVKKALSFDGRDTEFATMLTGDLNRLGGARALDGKVQCLDVAAGCLDALYKSGIVQATGFLYDCYLIYPDAADRHYREKFWEEMMKADPRVIVVTSHKCGLGRMDYTYSELNDWPQLRDYLADHYRLDADRVPPHSVHWAGSPGPPFGYRIYTRQGP